MSRADRSVLLVVSRSTGALGCNDCGAVLRCPDCGVALSVRRDRRFLACRLCAIGEPLPERCPECGGHKLAPFGWDPERVEASVRRRFPRLRVSRTDREAQVVIGTPALLRAPRARPWGAIGFIWLDGLLRAPDFRAGERVFQLLWAAAERINAGGRLVVQTLFPYTTLSAPSAARIAGPSIGRSCSSGPSSAIRRSGGSARSRRAARRRRAPAPSSTRWREYSAACPSSRSIPPWLSGPRPRSPPRGCA